jgi:2-octaprenyl-6-methoxyphenol hydroxylase|tara:strand:+ start:1587 stop:2684 length:1098 start_codon:yes stop_codon:yes gene_type:complete
MNVCIIGDGLTSLSLAKNLINKKINVHIYKKKIIKNLSSNRTIGISKNNFEFFKKEILDVPKKIIWEIRKIEIYSQKIEKDKILNFENNKNNLFYLVKNEELYKALDIKLMKSKFFKKKIIKQENFYERLLKKSTYDLIINCDQNNTISKKFFIKKIEKDYKNFAYTTILEHKKTENNTAIQVFTNLGPIAFLPISNSKTSVVCSLDFKNKNYSDSEILSLIKKYNPKFKIKKILKISSFELRSSNLRNYYHKNILAFGDMLHRIHPLAGQGFNMTIRDIKAFSEIIQNKIDLGLNFDNSILEEFQKKTKNKNFIFSSGIDFIYEFFKFEKKTKGRNLNKILKYFGANKIFMNSIIKLADKGLNI